MGQAEILLVEDNLGDQVLVREAFKQSLWAKEPHIVGNGKEALKFLRHQDGYAHVPRPDLVIVDLNLPDVSGRDIVAQLKQDRMLQTIPVVVFSTDGEHQKVASSYGAGADCYLRKPIDFEGYFRALNGLEPLWKTMSLYSHKPARRWLGRRNRRRPYVRWRKEAIEWAVLWTVFALISLGVYYWPTH